MREEYNYFKGARKNPYLQKERNLGKIFCIIAKSAAGKDTIYQKLINDDELNLKPIITCTSRPMRENEENGREYQFISNDTFNTFLEMDIFAETRFYNTAAGIWKYGTLKDSLDSTDNLIMITTPEAYEKLLEKYRERLIPIYISVPDDIRLLRAINREITNGEKANLKEVCRRFIADSEDFSDEILEKLNINKIFDNSNDCFEEVRNYIKVII